MPPSAIMKRVAAIYRRCGYIVIDRGKQTRESTGGPVYVLAIETSRQDEDMPNLRLGAVWMTPHRGDAEFEFVGSGKEELRNVLTSLGLAR